MSEIATLTTTVVHLTTSCTVAEFNAADGMLTAEKDAPIIAFTRIHVPGRAARLRLNNRDSGALTDCIADKTLPEPGYEDAWFIPSRTGTKNPEPYKGKRATNTVHEILKKNGIELSQHYISAINYDTMKIDGADRNDRVEINGINIRCEQGGIRSWLFR
jgi:hypothetical protein